MVGHPEALIDSDDYVEEDDDDLDGEVEDVEAGFTLIARWIFDRPVSTSVVGANSETRA